MSVQIQQYVEQVLDGSHYKGHVEIAGNTFDFELKFSVPIPELDAVHPAKIESNMLHFFQIALKKGGADIKLTTKREYAFFMLLIVESVVDFYNKPQTRASNDGTLGLTLQGGGSLAAVGGTASFSMTKNESYDLSPRLREMLSTPKFGCALAA